MMDDSPRETPLSTIGTPLLTVMITEQTMLTKREIKTIIPPYFNIQYTALTMAAGVIKAHKAPITPASLSLVSIPPAMLNTAESKVIAAVKDRYISAILNSKKYPKNARITDISGKNTVNEKQTYNDIAESFFMMLYYSFPSSPAYLTDNFHDSTERTADSTMPTPAKANNLYKPSKIPPENIPCKTPDE